ncbi:hypothetical protein C0Q70_12080 [Pomacea canaliculata]|uniref:Uncharacterized protein n=1 Tax=Pomacea canaliculata TaxID=400727 RepID=A0A2T7P0I6_POMCA|nr:hypothetical protein C0Q70_12080 [Pomacea canaliculata]
MPLYKIILSLSEVLPAKWFSSVRVHPPILPSSPQPPVPSIGLLRPDDIFSLGFVLATTICSSWRLGEPRRQTCASEPGASDRGVQLTPLTAD